MVQYSWASLRRDHPPSSGLPSYKSSSTPAGFRCDSVATYFSLFESILSSQVTMFPTASLTAFVCLAFTVAATPVMVDKQPVSLSFARHFNITGAHDVVHKDQARAKKLVSISQDKTLSPGAVVSVGVTNTAVVYEASVGVGSPATNCERLSIPFLVDILNTRFQTILSSIPEARTRGLEPERPMFGLAPALTQGTEW